MFGWLIALEVCIILDDIKCERCLLLLSSSPNASIYNISQCELKYLTSRVYFQDQIGYW